MSGLSRIIQHHIPLANKQTMYNNYAYHNTVYMCVYQLVHVYNVMCMLYK